MEEYLMEKKFVVKGLTKNVKINDIIYNVKKSNHLNDKRYNRFQRALNLNKLLNGNNAFVDKTFIVDKGHPSGEKIITETGAYASIFTNTKYIANTTLYAYWTPNPYTITTQHMKYNPETKDWELWKTTTETANYDATYTVKYITPETGYFEYMKDNNFTVKGNTTVQAKYHPKTYNLKLDYAGGLDKDDNVSTTDIITWIYGTGEGTDISDYTLC